ncbi:MAG: glycosyltransferase family 4 protein, partial [Ardenticatenaceae bacterium]
MNRKKNKKLALICQHFYPEMISTGIFMTQMATGLSRQGWAIRVYAGQPVYRDASQNGEAMPEREIYEGVEIIRVPAWGNARGSLLERALNAFTYLLMTAWLLFRDRKELRGVINSTNPPFLGLALCLVNLVAKLPFVTIVHDVYPDAAICLGVLKKRSLVTRVWEQITRWILNSSEGLIVIGRDMAQLVRQKLKQPESAKVTIIPNWADAERVYPVARQENEFRREQALDGRFVVQYSGRMGRTHNLEPLLEAAKGLQNEPVLFQFIGEGAKRAKLEAMSQEMGLQNVQFLPYQPFGKLAHVLSAGNLAVVCLESACTGVSVPSKTYGIMAAGRPILAFLEPESEIGQVIEETECGFVLPNPTGEEVATLIREVMSQPQRLRAMGCNGYDAFRQ